MAITLTFITTQDSIEHFIVFCPLYHVYNNVFSVAAEDNVPMEAVVSAEGIDAIVQTVADKYNQVPGDFTYEMTKAQLYYLVDLASGKGTYDVKPVWIVTGTEKSGQEQKQVQVIVDAQTAVVFADSFAQYSAE